MRSFIGSLIGLVLSVSVGAEPLLEGRVRLSSGQPAVGVQVRLFDLTDLRRFVGTTTDETGHFALPLQAFSTAKGTALPTDFALGQNYPNPFNPSTMEVDSSVYGLTVSGTGLIPYVNPTFRVGVDEGDIVVEKHGGARMKRTVGGVLGDVDGNGQVDIADALFVAMYSLDSSIVLPNNGDISRGDVNGDGLVDVADAVLLLRYLSNPSDPALPPGIGQDPDDTLDGATEVSLGSSTFGSLSEEDVDFFRVTMSSAGTLTAYTTGRVDTEGAILDSSGTVLASNSDSGTGYNFQVSTFVSAGTYYIGVAGWGSATGDYTLHVVGPLDLVVAASVNDSTLAFGQPFWLRATVRNQGGGEPEPTVLFYYRSTDATITSDDTQVSADVVSLETSNVVTKSLSLTAPEEAGSYYYGACVQSVSGEHNPDNNCSDAVRVTVSSEFVSSDIVAVMDGDYRTWHLPDGAMVRLGKGGINDIAFSPVGQYLAVASGIGVWMYEVATSRALMLIPTASSVTSVSFSPDGSTLASGADDGTVKLWDVATGAMIATLEGHTDGVTSVSFSPDGSTLASGADDGTVKLWDVATGAMIATLEGHTDGVTSVSFSPDGSTLASGADDGTVKLWDVATRAMIATLEGHTDGVRSVSFSPDGTTLTSSGGLWDGTVKLWDVATREMIATLEVDTDLIWSVSFSPDGKTLAAGTWDGTILLWDMETREIIATLAGHTDEVRSVSFSPDGTTLASGSGDDTVKLWDMATGEIIATLEGYTDGVRSVSFSPDMATLASGSWDGMIRLWDVATREIIATLEVDKWVWSVSFSPDGKTLAAGTWGTIRLGDMATREIIATLEVDTDGVWSVSFSPDGKTLAAGAGDDTILLWDVATREIIATLEGHSSSVWSVSFSPDGKTLAAGAEDGPVRLWDLATQESIATLEGHTDRVTSVSFSPDGATLASGSWDDTIRLWDVATHTTIATLEGHTDRVTSVSFSPDGATLASGADDGTVKLWDVATRAMIATLKGHANRVTSVSFSPDGATLASGSSDGTILLWGVAEWMNSGTAVAANKLIGLPDELQLQQNAPNPFNSQTVLSYFLPKSGPVRLELFSGTGQRVAILRQGPQQAGYHRLHWEAQDDEGRSLASGIYFYRLETTNGILTRKLTLLR